MFFNFNISYRINNPYFEPLKMPMYDYQLVLLSCSSTIQLHFQDIFQIKRFFTCCKKILSLMLIFLVYQYSIRLKNVMVLLSITKQQLTLLSGRHLQNRMLISHKKMSLKNILNYLLLIRGNLHHVTKSGQPHSFGPQSLTNHIKSYIYQAP